MLKKVMLDMNAKEFFTCSDINIIPSVKEFLSSDTWNEITVSNEAILLGFKAVLKYDELVLNSKHNIVFIQENKEYRFNVEHSKLMAIENGEQKVMPSIFYSKLSRIFLRMMIFSNPEDWLPETDEIFKK